MQVVLSCERHATTLRFGGSSHLSPCLRYRLLSAIVFSRARVHRVEVTSVGLHNGREKCRASHLSWLSRLEKTSVCRGRGWNGSARAESSWLLHAFIWHGASFALGRQHRWKSAAPLRHPKHSSLGSVLIFYDFYRLIVFYGLMDESLWIIMLKIYVDASEYYFSLFLKWWNGESVKKLSF